MTVISIGNGGGRPRKPTALKQLEGTARADRINPLEPTGLAIKIPRPPTTMTARQKKAWRAFAKVLDPMRVVTEADLAAFDMMVRSHCIVLEADESLRAAGSLLVTEDVGAGRKRIKRRPELDIIATHQKLLLLHYSRFGLTPADRSRVSTLEEARSPGKARAPVKDPIGEFEQ